MGQAQTTTTNTNINTNKPNLPYNKPQVNIGSYEFVNNPNFEKALSKNLNISPYTSSGTNPNQNMVTQNQNVNQNMNIPQYPSKKYKGTISLNELYNTFKFHAIDGTYLNKDRFNSTIESILNFDIPKLAFTYLSEKIYDLLDEVIIEFLNIYIVWRWKNIRR